MKYDIVISSFSVLLAIVIMSHVYASYKANIIYIYTFAFDKCIHGP